MKEFKYSIKCLLNRKELYLAFIGVLLTNLIHVFLVIHYNCVSHTFIEGEYTAEYLYILYNAFISVNMIIIIIFPIITSTVYSDINWIENKEKTNTILYTRLNRKKLIFSRFFLIILVVSLMVFLGFMMNYIVLSCIYNNGNSISYFQGPAFYLIENNLFFLDSIRMINPFLFIILITAHVSFLISLVACLSYSISFFTKQKFFIYLFPFLLIIGIEFFCSLFGINQYSIVTQLQPFSAFNIKNVLLIYFILIVISIILIHYYLRRKDIL